MTTNSKSRSLVRQGYKPWAIVDGKELVSYPWSENGVVKVNARTTPGDATTMETYVIEDGSCTIKDGKLILDWETCQRCRKAKPDVHERPNGYRRDVNNDYDAAWTACDECNEANNNDI
jgi:hypothetical protein